MKKYLYYIIFVILLIPCLIYAKHYLSWDISSSRSNTYITDFEDYNVFLETFESLNNVPYVFEDGALSYNSNYKYGALLNVDEYVISGGINSYLYNPNRFWLLQQYKSTTTDESNYTTSLPTEEYLFRTTEYVKSSVEVGGSGSYTDPWYFIKPKHATYTVEYYIQDLTNMSNYTLYSTETLIGEIGTTVSLSPISIEGFVSPSSISYAIEDGGKVSFKYNRNIYSLTLEYDGNFSGTVGSGMYYYGSTVNIDAYVKYSASGYYSWNRWTSVSGTLPSTFNYYAKSQSIVIGASNLTIKANGTKSSLCLTNPYSQSNTLPYKIISDNCVFADNVSSEYVTKSTGIDYNLPSGSIWNYSTNNYDQNGAGVYYTTLPSRSQDGKRVYFYRGVVNTNNLIFADYCWKILKINEDGSVKLRFAGNYIDYGSFKYCSGNTNGIGSSKFDNNISSNLGAGYMHGTSCNSAAACQTNTVNSTIKTIIDNWYVNNIASKGTAITSKIADTIYCNDRTVYYGNGYSSGVDTFYAGVKRTEMASIYGISRAQPTYACSRVADRFTVSSSIGNGKLTYPIALMSADEASIAGGESYTFLGVGVNYYLMTPFSFSSCGGVDYGDCSIYHSIVTSGGGVFSESDLYNRTTYIVPVISLKPTVTVTGNGEVFNPYEVN